METVVPAYTNVSSGNSIGRRVPQTTDGRDGVMHLAGSLEHGPIHGTWWLDDLSPASQLSDEQELDPEYVYEREHDHDREYESESEFEYV